MKLIIKQVDLITEIGTFKFKEHFNSTADFIEAMWLFDSNNYEQLGTMTYKLYVDHGDKIIETNFKGINASANLSCFIKDIKDRN